jgi:hypothetical protein
MIPDGFEGEQGFIRRMRRFGRTAKNAIDIRNAVQEMILDGGYPVALDDACDMLIDLMNDGLIATDAMFVLRAKMAE